MNSEVLAKSLIKLARQITAEKAALKFINFVKKKGLELLLPRVIFYLKTEQQKAEQKNTAKISVSHKVTGETLKQVEKFMGLPKTARKKIEINPKLIGGFIAEYSDTIYDGSIKGQLNKLSK